MKRWDWRSNLRPAKSETEMQTPRLRYNISSKEAVLPAGAMMLNWAPQTRQTFLRNTANIIKIWLDTLFWVTIQTHCLIHVYYSKSFQKYKVNENRFLIFLLCFIEWFFLSLQFFEIFVFELKHQNACIKLGRIQGVVSMNARHPLHGYSFSRKR